MAHNKAGGRTLDQNDRENINIDIDTVRSSIASDIEALNLADNAIVGTPDSVPTCPATPVNENKDNNTEIQGEHKDVIYFVVLIW